MTTLVLFPPRDMNFMQFEMSPLLPVRKAGISDMDFGFVKAVSGIPRDAVLKCCERHMIAIISLPRLVPATSVSVAPEMRFLPNSWMGILGTSFHYTGSYAQLSCHVAGFQKFIRSYRDIRNWSPTMDTLKFKLMYKNI